MWATKLSASSSLTLIPTDWVIGEQTLPEATNDAQEAILADA